MSKKSSIEIKEKKIGLTEKSNLLSNDNILSKVDLRIQELSKLIIEKKAAIKNAPEGSLRIAQSGKRIQYYHKTSEENPQGKYLARKDDKLAAALAQKDYDQKLLKELEEEIAALNKLKKNYHPQKLISVYEDMHVNRQHLVNPSAVSDADFSKAWEAFTYEGLPFSDDSQKFYTQKGERVRSQSEVLIANTLNQLEIPYRYEFPLLLKDGKGFSSATLIYPDFFCLNVRTRKEFIWENFTRMDDTLAANSAIEKINQFQNSGYIAGDKIIITMETTEAPLTEKQIQILAEKFLK